MPQEFERQLEALRQRFIGSLNERAHHLDNIWGYLRHMNWSTQGFNALQQFVHKQSEAGSSYGLPELRDVAQQLEAFLAELQELGRSFGGQEYAQLEEHVKHLARVMTATAQGSTAKDRLPAPIEKQAFPEAEGKLVFLIDPDRTLAALCSTYLRRVGFTVEYFETPQQCVQRLYEELPSIILMDPNFEREGLQALSNLHQLKTLLPPTSPVVLMSGRTDVNAKLRALRAAATHGSCDQHAVDQPAGQPAPNDACAHRAKIVAQRSAMGLRHGQQRSGGEWRDELPDLLAQPLNN